MHTLLAAWQWTCIRQQVVSQGGWCGRLRMLSTQTPKPSIDNSNSASAQSTQQSAHGSSQHTPAESATTANAGPKTDSKPSQGGLEQEAVRAHIESALASVKAKASVVAADAMKRLSEFRRQLPSTTPVPLGNAASKGLEKLYEASRLLNQFTGYSEVEALKQAVTEKDQQLTTAKQLAAYKKKVFEGAMDRQIQLQRDINKILERKSSWSDDDVTRFAALCRDEGKMATAVSEAKAAAETSVLEVDLAQEQYMQAMRERYTAEQLWGDKIRRAATWYTWGLMGLQLVSFVAVVMVVEPRRVRLLQEKVRELLEQQEGKTAEQVQSRIESHFQDLKRVIEESKVDVLHLDHAAALTAATAAGAGGTAIGPEHPTAQVEMAQMMSAVVSFMDGVHSELVQQRLMLTRLEQQTGIPAAQQALGTGSETDSSEAAQGAGTAAAAAAAAGRAAVDAGHEMHGASVAVKGGTVSDRRRLTLEQVVGVTAAVSAGVGALVGVLLVSYFSSGR